MLSKGKLKLRRNTKIDVIKFISACFVIFIHIVFPDNLGIAMQSIARFAVPLFFCISGFYSYGIEVHRIKKRVIYVIKLQLLAFVVFLLWGMWDAYFIKQETIVSYLKSRFTIGETLKFLIAQENSISGHIWYLTALMVCYLVLIAYKSLFTDKDNHTEYKYLYMLSLLLLVVSIVSNIFFLNEDTENHLWIFRNAWFTGLPFISLGIFIGQYKDRILSKLKINTIKLIIAIILGTVISVIQALCIYNAELPLGTVIVVPAIMLLAISENVPSPQISGESSMLLADASLMIYIFHLMIHNLMSDYSPKVSFLYAIFNHEFFYPIFVLITSVLLGFMLAGFSRKLKEQ